MASPKVPVSSASYAGDTKFFYEALRIWQHTNQIFRTWDRLTQVQRSAIMRDAQTLKVNAKLTIDEVLERTNRRASR